MRIQEGNHEVAMPKLQMHVLAVWHFLKEKKWV